MARIGNRKNVGVSEEEMLRGAETTKAGRSLQIFGTPTEALFIKFMSIAVFREPLSDAGERLRQFPK